MPVFCQCRATVSRPDDLIHLLVLDPLAALVEQIAQVADDEEIAGDARGLADHLITGALDEPLREFVRLVSGIGANGLDLGVERLGRRVLLDIVVVHEEAEIVRGIGITLLGDQGPGLHRPLSGRAQGRTPGGGGVPRGHP